MKGIAAGSDGVTRCWWAVGDPQYELYHDFEWGRPVHDDRRLFEKLSLEAFQSGLSWLVILRKRDAFRRAFAQFSTEAISAFGDQDVERLVNDAGIVRNRAKILAVIANARATENLLRQGVSLSEFLWSFAPRQPRQAPIEVDEVPAVTAESTAMAKALKARGFTFVGPTTCYATMQAVGMVNDHLVGCAFRDGITAGAPSPSQ